MRVILPLLLTGLNTRSAGPIFGDVALEDGPSSTPSGRLSLAALLSLRRSLIPFTLPSRLDDPDPDQLVPLKVLCGSVFKGEVMSAILGCESNVGPAVVIDGGFRISGGIGDCGNSLYPAGVGGTGPSCVPRCGGALLVGAASIGTLAAGSSGGTGIAFCRSGLARDMLTDRDVLGGGPGGGGSGIPGAQ